MRERLHAHFAAIIIPGDHTDVFILNSEALIQGLPHYVKIMLICWNIGGSDIFVIADGNQYCVNHVNYPL